ncbi:MAG: hypothetical protein ACI4VM_01095, partial [Anaerovoracaceae bacterium]
NPIKQELEKEADQAAGMRICTAVFCTAAIEKGAAPNQLRKNPGPPDPGFFYISPLSAYFFVSVFPFGNLFGIGSVPFPLLISV